MKAQLKAEQDEMTKLQVIFEEKVYLKKII